jgi:manganese/iron transport system substrate-binding protein
MNTLLQQLRGPVTMLLSVGLVTSCAPPPRQPDANAPATSVAPTSTVKVVATSSVLCDLTKQIAAATVDLTCLVKPGSDPHVYQATPEDRKAIESANLILYSGYDFEPSLIQLIQATSNPAPKVAIAEVAVSKPLQLEEDGKTVTDPHVWHSAQNGIQMVAAIQSNLSKVMPANAELYTKNAQVLTAELTKIDSWIKSQITTIPESSRKLVTTHDALGYYSQAYGIPVEGALEGISTEEQPTANRVKELVKTIAAEKVPTIFAELTINPKLLETVAKEAKVKVAKQELFADGLGEAGSAGETYQKMLAANTKAIVEGLGGKFSPLN